LADKKKVVRKDEIDSTSKLKTVKIYAFFSQKASESQTK
jgi:hypothetical protein